MKNSGNIRRFVKKIAAPLVLLLLAYFIPGCGKLPTADFNTDKTDYNAGETVTLSNTSVNAQKYVWTFPNGQSSTEQDVVYTFNNNTPGGEYAFTLQAFGEKKKNATVTKSVKVAGATGRITAWTSNNTVGLITVKADNEVIGTIGAFYTFNPGCGANGCVNTTLTVGVHTITALYAGTSSSGTVNISKGNCSVYELQ